MRCLVHGGEYVNNISIADLFMRSLLSIPTWQIVCCTFKQKSLSGCFKIPGKRLICYNGVVLLLFSWESKLTNLQTFMKAYEKSGVCIYVKHIKCWTILHDSSRMYHINIAVKVTFTNNRKLDNIGSSDSLVYHLSVDSKMLTVLDTQYGRIRQRHEQFCEVPYLAELTSRLTLLPFWFLSYHLSSCFYLLSFHYYPRE